MSWCAASLQRPTTLRLKTSPISSCCNSVASCCRLQRDQAAHAHTTNRQTGDELVEAQAHMTHQAARLSKESERRRHLEALLEEGLQVQNQILVGLQVQPFQTPC